MEAIGAAASIVGIVSFGLGLAKSLQTFVDTMRDAEETIILVVSDMHSTALTLNDLQEFIDQDKAASEELKRTPIFNATSLTEIHTFASHCERIYNLIIGLIEKANMQVGKDVREDTEPQAPAPDGRHAPMARLAVFSKTVTRLGRKIKWPSLEPRMQRCQERLRELKGSLMLRLLVIATPGTRAPYA